MREPGVETLDLLRICALRIRVIRSLMGSCVLMLDPPSPARLHETRNESLGTEFAHGDTAEFRLAIDRARTAGQFAAVADPGRRRVARQRRKLQRRGKPLFHRLLLVG